MLYFWLAVTILLLIVGTLEFYAMKTGLPTVTSRPAIRRKFIELLKKEASARRDGFPASILDFGSGTGLLSMEVARAFPQARLVGVDLAWMPLLLANYRRWLWGHLHSTRNAHFIRANFWGFDVKGYDAVLLYINANVREGVATKLKQELSPGTFVISNETFLPGWEPEAIHEAGLLKLKVVVYRTPAANDVQKT